jgi:hypothetical protein
VIGVHWGILGVAVAYALVYFAGVMYPGFEIPFRLIGLKWSFFLSEMLPVLAASAVMVLGCMAWLFFLETLGLTNPAARLFTTVPVGVIIYIGVLLASRARVLGHIRTALRESGAPGAPALVRLLSRFA